MTGEKGVCVVVKKSRSLFSITGIGSWEEPYSIHSRLKDYVKVQVYHQVQWGTYVRRGNTLTKYVLRRRT